MKNITKKLLTLGLFFSLGSSLNAIDANTNIMNQKIEIKTEGKSLVEKKMNDNSKKMMNKNHSKNVKHTHYHEHHHMKHNHHGIDYNHMNHSEHHHMKHKHNSHNKHHHINYYNNNGFTLGFSGHYGAAINSNSDFIVNPIAEDAPIFDPVLQGATNEITFAQKYDSLYGGAVSFGYMMNSGIEANAELSFNQLKLKDNNHKSNSIDANIFGGTVGMTYYADIIPNILTPYLGFGIGFARVNAKGKLYDAADITADATNLITFEDLIKTTLQYKLKAGISKSLNNTLIGFGYEFVAINSIADAGSDLTVKVAGKNAAGAVTGGKLQPTEPFKFNSLRLENHNLSLFVKFIV